MGNLTLKQIREFMDCCNLKEENCGLTIEGLNVDSIVYEKTRWHGPLNADVYFRSSSIKKLKSELSFWQKRFDEERKKCRLLRRKIINM